MDKSKPNKLLKKELIFLSFSPLFILSCIRYSTVKAWTYPKTLYYSIKTNTPIVYKNLCQSIIIYTAIILFLISFICYIHLKLESITGYIDKTKEGIKAKNITSDSLLFFLAYIIPFAMAEITSINKLLCFLIVLNMICLLLYNTNLYYQNPILALFGYKVYEFSIPIGNSEIESQKIIGIQQRTFDNSKKIQS